MNLWIKLRISWVRLPRGGSRGIGRNDTSAATREEPRTDARAVDLSRAFFGAGYAAIGIRPSSGTPAGS
jgi:hypothetical protein